MAKLLNDEVIQQVQNVFEELVRPVELIFFGKDEDCEFCDDTLQLAKEVSDLSDQLSLSIYDIEADPNLAELYQVDKAPSLVIASRDGEQIFDHGIRFAGIPSGHEFTSLINSLILVSKGDSGLSQSTRDYFRTLQVPVNLLVYVTPT